MDDHGIVKRFTVDGPHDGVRIDKYLSEMCGELSRSSVQNMILSGGAAVNGTRVSKNFRVSQGDEVELEIPEPAEYEAKAENIPLDIAYEDGDLIVVNKPKGMVVHPAAGNYEGTLVNALLYHCGSSLSGINGVMRPGIVHRIDKDTSGLLIVAKNDMSHNCLAQQIKEHSFKREYEAVVCGRLKHDEGRIDLPIGRHHTNRKKMAVTDRNSKNAVTNYRVIRYYDKYTHVRLRLETGRTHQIRVHMSYIGHPVAGDCVYGARAEREFDGQCLHARTIGFIHPATGEYMEFVSELPDYFKAFLDKLERMS